MGVGDGVDAVMEELPVRERFSLVNVVDSKADTSLVYFDSAATGLMPRSVINAIVEYEECARSNIHRGIHRRAEVSTQLYEDARRHLAVHLNCAPENLIFTHGTTESINMIARTWAFRSLSAHDTIVLAVDNHHANIVPWQMVAEERGLHLVFVEVAPDGEIDPGSWEQALSHAPELVALTHVSNVTGVEHPIDRLVAEAHAVGAKALVDCAQSFGHQALDMQRLGADAIAGSCHKAYGPFGFGFLACSDTMLEALYPCFGGGGMITSVTREGFLPAEGSVAFEAGTPVVSAAAGLKASLEFLDEVGLETISRHTAELSDRMREGLRHIEGIRIVADRTSDRKSTTPDRCSIVSFTSEHYHPHDIAARLDEKGIAVRAGHHCAMPLHQAWGIPASVRASFGIYNEASEVDLFLEVLRDIVKGEHSGITYRHRR